MPPLGDPPQQLLEHHADLEARERRAEAEVRPEPERDVVVVLAEHVERVRLVEHGLVAVRRAVHQQDLVARADRLAVQLVVLGGGAAHVEDRRDPPDELLDARSAERSRVVDQEPRAGRDGGRARGTSCR